MTIAKASRLRLHNISEHIEDGRRSKAAIQRTRKTQPPITVLGTCNFAREKTDEALAQWQQARSSIPKYPCWKPVWGLAFASATRDSAVLNAIRGRNKNDS